MSKHIVVVLLAVMIAVSPLLSACGNETTRQAEIVVGIAGDFTSASSHTIAQVYKGMTDAFSELQEDDPIPGARIRVINHDHRNEYARGVSTYHWLVGRGSVIQLQTNPFILATYEDRLAKDKMPTFAFTAMRDTVDKDWIFSHAGIYEWEAESMIDWLVNQSGLPEAKGRALKVGLTGPMGFVSTVVYSQSLRAMLDAQPGLFELTEANHPMGTTAFSTEVGKLMNCDVVIMNALGPSNPAFIREARTRGFEGAIVGTGISILGYWDLIKASVTQGQLAHPGGLYAIHTQCWWTDPGSLWADLESTLRRLRPGEADTLMLSGSWGAGWLTAMIFHDVIKRAVEAVGADNVDGTAIWNAVLKTDMSIPGYGESFRCREGEIGWNVLNRTFIMRQYKPAQDDWFAVSDWFLPPSLR